jgi:prevent-host-death family protein
MDSVGIRELRQNASALLERVVSTGVTIEITNHGHPVARLVPIGSGARSRVDLINSGELRPGRGDPLAVAAVVAPETDTSTLLAEGRQER